MVAKLKQYELILKQLSISCSNKFHSIIHKAFSLEENRRLLGFMRELHTRIKPKVTVK